MNKKISAKTLYFDKIVKSIESALAVEPENLNWVECDLTRELEKILDKAISYRDKSLGEDVFGK